ncbi:WD40 domain-containing protein [Cephalotus follicularis]|uniref:WD40 domain-containing protein n=1 Tax=Cephalotus follicularis TaxID=3775 RepID=A0A1Q3BH84_CEPFO|nr:WD40 domain-containing protein [Cephalotus follicularis]
MKNKNPKRKGSAAKPRGFKRGREGLGIKEDPFFENKKRKTQYEDNIESEEEEEEEDNDEGLKDVEEEEETLDEKRNRVAKEYIETLKRSAQRRDEDEEEDEDDEKKIEKEGERDSLIDKILQQEHLEDTGRVRRLIASRVQKPETQDEFQVLVKHRQSVTAVALSDDDLRGFSASKDGTILHWDVDSGKGEKYLWPSEEVLRSHGARNPQGRASKHSKLIYALAVSSDGRYLASGGLDRHVHLWDTRTREHIQAFPGHRGPVSCLTFRQGTSELFSGSFDRTVKIWNVEDRAYINTLFGHQSEILTIDCLRKERVLTVGRDRSMQLFKVPEESRLIFRAPASSLECCCFINNDEFLSGSDDGSVELWSILKKKPAYIVKNAHALLAANNDICSQIPNGHLENGDHKPESYHSSSAYSWVSSVTVCRGSDIAASGAGNGSIRLWALESDAKNIRPLFDLPLVGFVNSLDLAKSGQFLIAGVGQEPRLGRWGRLPAARNGVAIQRLKLS